MKRIIGIDLGTTNCCLAVMEGDEPIVIPNLRGNLTTPSFFAVDEDSRYLVGEIAKRQAVVNPENTVFSVKRLIGRRYRSEEIQNMINKIPFTLVESQNGDVEIVINEKRYTPQEISAIILRELKHSAEEYLQEPVQEAVITVPAYFSDSQRQATKDAGLIAGFDVQRIINEPTAAAISYGFNRGEHKKIAVYDLGGGTFDISILEIGEGLFEVLSTSGDNNLGGEDFDRRVMGIILDDIMKTSGIDLHNDKMAIQRIKEAAEKAKCELSERERTEITLPFIARRGDEPIHFQMSLTRDNLVSCVGDLVEKTLTACNRALDDAKLKPTDIDEVILVGGQTKMPHVQLKVKEFFYREPCKGVNPDEVVAIGAALQGGIIAGEVKDLILLDVTPRSLGIETDNGQTTNLIPRNTAIPARVSKIFTTVEDNQRTVQIRVVQGERAIAAENIALGQFELVGILPAMRGVPKIEVTFDIDTDGIIHVAAKDLATGREQGIQITGKSGLNQQQVREMAEKLTQTIAHTDVISDDLPEFHLDRLLEDFRNFIDKHENRFLESEKTEARSLIQQAEKLQEDGDPKEKEEFAKLLRARILYLTSSIGKNS